MRTTRLSWCRRFAGFLMTSALFVLWPASLWAHNLMQADTSLTYDATTLGMISQRAALGQPLFQAGDIVGLVLKSTPGPGTLTGVGGYMTFYIPPGTQVLGVEYVRPDPTTNGVYYPVPIKGQSIIAIGAGSIGAKATPELYGLSLGPNINGVRTSVVDSTNYLHRGTIAGVYADTGIFYSTDPKTIFGSWTNSGGWDRNLTTTNDNTIVNNRGLSIVPITEWDAEQEIAYGLSSPVRAIVDYVDERGNAPWGLANVVAGPQSGYAWQFDWLTYSNVLASTSSVTNAMQQALTNVGPWQRIKYPGSQVSMDIPGLISTTLGYAGIDASSVGYDLGVAPLPPTTSWATNDFTSPKAIRISEGELILGKPEFARVYLKLINPQSCFPMYSDAFGGDAGGEQGGKDHLWRYYNPTIQVLMPCAALQKVVNKSVVNVGSNVVFAISFINSGNVPYPNFVISDTLPTGLTYISASPTPSVISGSTLTWNLGTVNAYSNITLYVTAQATGSGTLFNTVCATSAGTSVGCSQDSVTIGALSDLVYDKRVTPTAVTPGATVQYTLSVTNVGTGINGTPLIINEMLPAGFT